MGRAVLELSIEGGAFVRGAADAKATMRDMARGIAQVQRDIGKQAFQFSGRAQIAEAAKIVEAVNRVGGASKLVAADQAKVNAAVKQGIEYYKVLGKEAPKAWLDVEKATRKVATANTDVGKGLVGLTGIAGKAAAALGGFVSAGAILGAVKGALAYGEAIEKAGIAVGGTATQVQRLENIAASSNTTLDAVIRSLTTLQDRVGGEDVATMDALKELRVDAQELMALSPDKQLIAIANAMQRISSHSRQITLTKDLFGPGGVEIFGTMRKDIDGVADSVTKLSDLQIQKLADVEARWDRVTLAIGRNTKALLMAYFLPGKPAGPPAPSFSEPTELTVANERMAQWRTPDMAAQLKEAQVALKGLSVATLAQLTAAKQLATTTDKDLLTVLRRVGVDGDKAKNVLKLLEAQTKKTGTSANTAAKEWQAFIDRFTGASTMETALDLGKAIGTGQIQLAKLTQEAQQTISKALEDGAEAWKAWGGVVPAQINGAIAAVNQYKHSVLTIPSLNPDGSGFKTPDPPSLDDMREQLEALERPINSRIELEREAAKISREIEFQRAEFAIEQAKRWGASLEQVNALESDLSRRRLAAAIADADREFKAKKDALDKLRGVTPYPAREKSAVGEDEPMFREWYAGMAQRYDLAPNPDAAEQFYDYRGAYRAGAAPDAETQHWPSQFKLPGHPNMVVGGYNVQTGRPEPGAPLERNVDKLVDLGWDPETAAELVAMPEVAVDDFQKEMAALEQAHKATVDQMVDEQRLGEIAKREEIRKTRAFWNTELGKGLLTDLRGIAHESTGRLFSTLFARGDDEAKKRAKEAREDYERIAKSGKASAEEITRAFRAMRQAEEAAQSKWADRFKGMWDAIKRHIFNIFDQILEQFVNNFLKGLLNSFLGTGFGQKLGQMFGGLFGGSGGGGGFEIPGLGGAMPSLLSKIPGLGGVFGGALPGTGVLMSGIPGAAAAPSLGSLLGAAPGGAAAAGGGGALGFLANPAFWSNPYTIAAMVGVAAFPLIKKGVTAIAKGIGDGIAALARGIAGLFGSGTPNAGAYLVQHFGSERQQAHFFAQDPEQEKYRRPQRHDAQPAPVGHRPFGTFHTGGIIGEQAGRARDEYQKRFGDLKPGEIIIKALKGEAVLTPQATAAIGGKPIIDFINAGNGAAIKDALQRKEIDLGDVVSAFIQTHGHEGGGFLSGSLGALAPRSAMPIASPWQGLHRSLDRAMTPPDIANPDNWIKPGGGSRGDTDPPGGGGARHTTIKIEIKALDGADVEKVVRQKIAPRLRWMMSTDQDGMGSQVRRTALT